MKARIIYNKIRYLVNKFKIEPLSDDFKQRINEFSIEQLRIIALPLSFLSIFVWLNFAFHIDPKIHPEFPEIFYYRIGLSFLSFFVFIFCLIPGFREFRQIGVYLISYYTAIVCAIFTGRLVDDPDYVSGYQLLIMILAILPIRLRILYSLFIISITLFVSSVFYYKTQFGVYLSEYSLNNLLITILFAFFMSYYLKKFRVSIFINHLKLTELKEKQDGDYFLNLLLLKPFFKLKHNRNFFDVETYVSQKKKFHFRGKEYEIGGDIIITDNIRLQDTEYMVFVNADAMGKSIQGAGGVLVLGVALEILLSHFKNDANIDVSPKDWLTQVFRDLQKSFEKFHGSMLVSAVVGLLDKKGKLLFFNAEHPYPVLYRDGLAEFLGENQTHYKLGTETIDSDLLFMKIIEYTLHQDDVIIIGSDGKDDIESRIIGPDGVYTINYDEKLFLQFVEKAKGDLKRIVKRINNHGNLIDDISLLKIGPVKIRE